MIQVALVTWIIWETVKVWLGRKIPAEWQFIPVTLLAATVYLSSPWFQAAQNVFSAVAVVALLHYLLSSVERRR